MAIAPGEGGTLFGRPDVDAQLARPYAPHVPMACVGECLWAAHPEGWAFGNGINYYLLGAEGLGFNLEIEHEGQILTPGEGTFYPSHIELSAAHDGLRVAVAKWITDDDVLAVELTFTNTTDDLLNPRVRLSLPSTTLEQTKGAWTWRTQKHGLNVIQQLHAPKFARPKTGDVSAIAYWAEGEAPVAQRGSQGPDAKAAARNGHVLGSNFGGHADDHAAWEIDVAEPLDNAALSIRYARANTGDALWTVKRGDTAIAEYQAFHQTGGWGDDASHFAVATFPLGAVPVGRVTFGVRALADNANVNFDALCVHPADQPMPSSSAATVLERNVPIAPESTMTLRLFLAAGTQLDAVENHLARVTALNVPLDDQIERYAAWLTNVPVFRGNSTIEKQYWHRAASVLRKNLFRVGVGRLGGWSIAEGRWNSTWYPNTISYGAGHQIRECRWLRDPQYVRGIISTWCDNPKDDGVFPNYIRPAEIGGGQYTDWITSTVWDAHCVAPDNGLLRIWTPALMANVDGWLARYDADDDGLLLVDSHWWTGMEWQPSFFAFHEWDKDLQDQKLERVDLTAYVYGSAKNLARMLTATGDAANAKKYDAIASKIHDAVAGHMWDEETGYFYSIAPDTHEKAGVKEVVGVYPWYFSMFRGEPEYVKAWAALVDPGQLWTPWPVASASQECPAYSQDELFHDKHVGGCMWNGPTWPHANSLVLSAMAAALRENKNAPVDASHFHALLQSFTLAQFKDQDLTYPWTGEYYNGDTGVWRTAERDYNHSTYLDVIIADWAGLRPRSDDVIEVQPIIDPNDETGFIVDGIRYHNHDVTIAFHPSVASAEPYDQRRGLRIYVDGHLVHHDPTASPRPVRLPNYGLLQRPG